MDKRGFMVGSEGHTRVANRVKISLGPLLERARILRRDAARLVRELGKTSAEITALQDPSPSTESSHKQSDFAPKANADSSIHP